MTSHTATVTVALGIAGLFVLDRDGNAHTSKALWIPVVWLAVAASRMMGEWLAAMGVVNGGAPIDSADQLLDGSPLDRFLLTMLLALGIVVLLGRRRSVGALLRANVPILIFFLYCGASTLWSDYTDVSFKRWVKALGDLAMLLIVLTDRNPFVAVKRLLTRVGFLLVPVSILLIKYYPDLGRGWSEWGGGFYKGVASSKNELGGVCLLFGLGSAWRVVQALRGKGSKIWIEFPARAVAIPRSLIAHGALLAMVIWLFWMANTVTAISCFLMASVLVMVTNIPALTRKPWRLHFLVTVMLSVSVCALFLGLGTGLVETMGRDPTLTGRTQIWHLVLSMTTNPLLGTGFESFWLGPRLQKIWSIYWWRPNEAHNAYIEVFLNLGWIGIALLAVLVTTGYQKVFNALRRDPDEGGLRLAYFVTALAYNCTESSIRIMHPVWIFFLLATITVPGGWERSKKKGRALASREAGSQLVPCLEEA